MKDLLDVHTHTIASGHAYSTLREMIEAAKRRGLSLIGISEHGPRMEGSCPEIYFCNFNQFSINIFITFKIFSYLRIICIARTQTKK